MRITAVGLCRTDYHVMRGERRVAMRPLVIGHEAAGVVEEIGAKVGEIKRGDTSYSLLSRPVEFAGGVGRVCIIFAPKVRA